MQSTTPRGPRRIWAMMPSSMTKREETRSRSFRAAMVSWMYLTVRSNSLVESVSDLQTSHINRGTMRSFAAVIRTANRSMCSMRSDTLIVGHGPRPWS